MSVSASIRRSACLLACTLAMAPAAFAPATFGQELPIEKVTGSELRQALIWTGHLRAVGRRPDGGAAEGEQGLAGRQGLRAGRQAERGPGQRADGRGGEAPQRGRLVDPAGQVGRPFGRRADQARQTGGHPHDEWRHDLRLRRQDRLHAGHPLWRLHLQQLRLLLRLRAAQAVTKPSWRAMHYDTFACSRRRMASRPTSRRPAGRPASLLRASA